MVRSLNGQLLKFMTENRPNVGLVQLKDQTFFTKSKRHLKHELKLLKALISFLADGDVVFVILDVLSGSRSGKKAKQVIDTLGQHHQGSTEDIYQGLGYKSASGLVS